MTSRNRKPSKSKSALLFVLLLTVLGQSEVAWSKRAKGLIEESCFPETSLRFPVKKDGQKLIGDLDQAKFELLLAKFQQRYGQIAENTFGKKLLIKGDWQSAEVNAHATRDDNGNPVITVTGGMARHPEMNEDAITLILCHEAGHPFGGAPKQFRGQSQLRSWSSAEGQADYFAVNKCLPRLWFDDENTKLALSEYPKEWVENARKHCMNDVCTRILLAGLTTGRMFASLKAGGRMPELEDKDPTNVSVTRYTHPRAQCRVDTFVAGTLCSVAPDINFDSSNANIGACVSVLKEADKNVATLQVESNQGKLVLENGGAGDLPQTSPQARGRKVMEEDPRGARPNCWFNAEAY